MKSFRKFALGMATLTLLTVCSAAFATDLANAPWTVTGRVGAYVPFEDGVKAEADVWLSLGAEVTTEGFLGPNSQTYLSVDIANPSWGKETNTIVPMFLGQKFFLGSSYNSDSRPYFGVGVGAILVDIGGPSKSKLGGKISIGMESGDRFTFDASYMFSDRFDINDNTETARMNGLHVSLGYRF